MKETRNEIVTNHKYKGVDYDLKVVKVDRVLSNGTKSSYTQYQTRISYSQDYTGYETKKRAIEMIELIIDDYLENKEQF